MDFSVKEHFRGYWMSIVMMKRKTKIKVKFMKIYLEKSGNYTKKLRGIQPFKNINSLIIKFTACIE